MAKKEYHYSVNLSERKVSIAVLALFSSWLLAFAFEGRILYAISDYYNYDSHQPVLASVAGHAAGLLFWGFIIKKKKTAKILMLASIVFCIIATGVFFFSPSLLWLISLVSGSFIIAAGIVAWSFYFKSGTPKNERIKTAAYGLIFSNILMVFLNMTAIHVGPHIGLGLSILMLVGAFLFTLLLPTHDTQVTETSQQERESGDLVKPLAFLCLFILIITINSGLMYRAVTPAFSHLKGLTSWYWAIPYIFTIYFMKKYSRKTNRSDILYIAIAMIGLSFVFFMTLDHSTLSYLVVNTLMMAAYGVYDLFWWSILGEMLDLKKNPAYIFSMGLSANVIGVMMGGMIGKVIISSEFLPKTSSSLALAIVFICLIILPLLHRYLSEILKNHAFLSILTEMPPDQKNIISSRIAQYGNLSEREVQVSNLLLQGKTYRTIAGDLNISENTVKFHVRNIYSKLNIQSRAELIDLVLEKQDIAKR